MIAQALKRVTSSGPLSTNLAIALFGLSGVVGKATGLSAPLIVFGRCIFGALAIWAVVRLAKRPIQLRKAQTLLLTGQGLVLAVHWVTFFQAINIGGVAVGLLSFSTFPFFVALLEPLVLKRRPTVTEVVASGVTMFGVYILIPSFSLESDVFVGVLWGLASAATFGFLSVFNRRLGQTHDSTVISLFQFVVSATALLPLVVLNFSSDFVQPVALLQLLFLGTVCTALAHTLFISGMRHISAMLASVFATLEPVWGIAFAIVLLGERPSARSLAGGCIIVGATAVVALRHKAASAEIPD